MTDIRKGAWYCLLCKHCIESMCRKDVPYYCSTVDCKFWEEKEPEKQAFVSGRRCGKSRMAKLIHDYCKEGL